jgi:hypothetical protein
MTETADLVMLYKITHELVTIPKTDILIPPVRFSWNMHSLSYQIPSTCIQLRQQSFFSGPIQNRQIRVMVELRIYMPVL